MDSDVRKSMSDQIVKSLIEKLEKEGRLTITLTEIMSEYNVGGTVGRVAERKFLKYIEQNLDKYILIKNGYRYFVMKRNGQNYPKEFILGIIATLRALSLIGYGSLSVPIIEMLRQHGINIDISETNLPFEEILNLVKSKPSQ